jgi:tetratricopeptide (TPR) repeat protein
MIEDKMRSARRWIEEGDRILKGMGGSWQDAERAYANALELLGAEESLQTTEDLHQYAWAWMNRGNLYGMKRSAEGLQQALECYERAMRAMRKIVDAERTDDIKADLGALLANQGHAYLRLGGQQQWEKAVDCYQNSVAIFDQLPWRNHKRFHHHLIGGWYNLGNALQMAANAHEDTVRCYENALALAQDFQPDELGHFLLLAGIWLNYGNTIGRTEEDVALEKALRCYDNAIRLFQHLPLQPGQPHGYELASALANRANILSLEGKEWSDPNLALQVAQQALDIVKEREETDLYLAEISLKARRARCQAYGLLLPVKDELADERYHSASDEVDRALELIFLWEQRKVPAFRDLAVRLFHFGSHLYRIRQPQFLAEFVEEALNGIADPRLLAAAKSVVSDALTDLKERQTVVIGTQATETLLSIVRELEDLQQRFDQNAQA